MKIKTLILILFACSLASCAPLSPPPTFPEQQAITIKNDQTLLSRFAPIFIIENAQKTYNLIGTPQAKRTNGQEEKVFVDPSRPTVYTETRKFKTPGGSYKNLIYRIHFEKIPSQICPFYLGAGSNVGLIVVITLNHREEPLLYTMVHTCGCYLTFIPTSFMPEYGFPEGWEKKQQIVYAEKITGLLSYPETNPKDVKTMILLRDGTHRVKDVWLSPKDALPHSIVRTSQLPLDALEKLALGNGTTSFYETTGPRKGYVKGSHKIREKIFMGWWAFDWRVGEDKKLGSTQEDGILFYTSLKPWAREASDLRTFELFLKYWKWRF